MDFQELLEYNRVYTIDPIGRSGELALFWKNSVDLEFLFADKNMLDIKVEFGSVRRFVSCIYGDSAGKIRHLLWERLYRIGVNRKEAWSMFGDFNDIIHSGEKIGGPSRNDMFMVPLMTR